MIEPILVLLFSRSPQLAYDFSNSGLVVPKGESLMKISPSSLMTPGAIVDFSGPGASLKSSFLLYKGKLPLKCPPHSWRDKTLVKMNATSLEKEASTGCFEHDFKGLKIREAVSLNYWLWKVSRKDYMLIQLHYNKLWYAIGICSELK